jgi:hypothetical protein
MDSFCVNSPASVISVIGLIVTGASSIANFIPAPDKIDNKALKLISKIIHFLAVDIVTAKKS